MRLLFIHQSFPGQFSHLAAALSSLGHDVRALTMWVDSPKTGNVQLIHHRVSADDVSTLSALPPNLYRMNMMVLSGQSVAREIRKLKEAGWIPDAVIVHSGWGEAYFIKDELPNTPLGVFAEFFYHASGYDTNFDPEFVFSDQGLISAELSQKNVHLLQALYAADAVLCPTRFQRLVQPAEFQHKISVIHEGIETYNLHPNPNASISLPDAGVSFKAGDEVITFVSRGLELVRGFHTFMRALPEIMAQRPNARVIIVGDDKTHYGMQPPLGHTWRGMMTMELQDKLDFSRINFVGKVSRPVLNAILQISAAHVYLTYPFVLSWSLLEAMSIGCPIIASKTPPVEEVIENGKHGILVDYFDQAALVSSIVSVLANPEAYTGMRQAARDKICKEYDLLNKCLPAHIEWVKKLAAGNATEQASAKKEQSTQSAVSPNPLTARTHHGKAKLRR